MLSAHLALPRRETSRFGTATSLEWAPLASTGWRHGRSKARRRDQACCVPAAQRDALCLRRRRRATAANIPCGDAGRPRLCDCECVDVAALTAELASRLPDLVVIGSSTGGIEACKMVELL